MAERASFTHSNTVVPSPAFFDASRYSMLMPSIPSFAKCAAKG